MTIDEAIRLKSLPTLEMLKTDPYLLLQADRLGIEALKRHSLRREHPKRKFPELLVGETKEG